MANQVETIIQVDREDRDRVTAFFRWVLIIPIAIFIGMFVQAIHWGITSFVIMVPVIFSLLFRQVYPSWILTFNHAILEFSMRIAAYGLFLTDRYPTLEANSNVAVILPDVEGGKKLNRWLPVVKWLLAIPLYVVGILYLIYAAFATVYLWLEISFLGKSSNWAIDANLNTIRYWNRVFGYAILLVTDEYPTFALK